MLRAAMAALALAALTTTVPCSRLLAQADQASGRTAETLDSLLASNARKGDAGTLTAIAQLLLTAKRQGAVAASLPGLRSGEGLPEAVWRYLRAAVEREPGFPLAAVLATELLVAKGDRRALEDESWVLSHLLRVRPQDGLVLLIAAREQRIRGGLDSARSYLSRARASGGDLSGVAFEMARTYEASGDRERALQEYWSGITKLTPMGRSLYQYDFGWLAPPESLSVFDDGPADSVAAWARRFWARRDADAAGQPDDRLWHHLRRWRVAVDSFRVLQPTRRTQFRRVEVGFEDLDECVGSNEDFYDYLSRTPSLPGDLRSSEPLFDHRGLVVLRHGLPDLAIEGHGHGFPSMAEVLAAPSTRRAVMERSYAMDQSMATNATWVYEFGGKVRALHFRGSQALGLHGPTTLTSYLPLSNAVGRGYSDDWEARGRHLALFAEAVAELRTATQVPGSCRKAVQRLVTESRADASEGVRTDSDTPQPSRPWGAFIEVFGLGTASGSHGRAVVAWAIPVSALAADTLQDGRVIVKHTWRLVAYNPRTGARHDADTTRQLLIRTTPGPESYLTGVLELPLPVGEWQLAIRGYQPGDSLGAFALRRDVPLPPPAGLALSDLVTGTPGGNPQWNPGGVDPFAINPFGTWEVGTFVELYAEIYGLQAGSEYENRIDVEPITGDPREAISISTTERAAGSWAQVRRALDIRRLSVGTFRIRLSITQQGRKVTRERVVRITSPR